MTPEQVRASIVDNAKRVKKEIIKPLYKKLIKDGWTLNAIDEMDIHFYLDLYSDQEQETTYIDEIRLF